MCFEQFLGCVNTLGIAFSRPGCWRSRCPRNSSGVGAGGAARGGLRVLRSAMRAAGVTVQLSGVQPAQGNAGSHCWGTCFVWFLHRENGV